MRRHFILPVCLTLLVFVLGFGSAAWGAVSAVSGISSSSHTINVLSTDATIDMSWSVPSTDDDAAIDGYSIVFSTASDTDPEPTNTPTADYAKYVTGGTAATSDTLPDGTNWYFHIRARDVNGEWSVASHFGPFVIDTTPVPQITSISPTSGVNSSSTISVTITGKYFKKLDGSSFNSVTAKIGNTALTGVTVASSTSITATYAIQNKTAEAKDVSVTTDWGTSTPLSEGFTVTNPAPTVTAISPSSASNAAEKSVTITGTGFLSTTSTPVGTAKPTVQLKQGATAISLTSVTWVSKTSLTATVPAGKTAGTYDVVVTNSDSQIGTLSSGFEIKLPAPTLSSVSPSSGTNDVSNTITLTGTNFATSGGTPQVTLEADGKSAIACTSEAVSSATSMTAVVPGDSTVTGTYSVKVTNPDGQTAIKSAAFTINNPVPTVTSITPSSMTNSGTQSVTIVGTKFRTGIKVWIGSTECTGVTLDSTTPKTKLTATVPAGITAGTYDVILKNEGVTTTGTLSSGFTVNAAVTTVAVTYSASDTTKVPAGALTITATFSQSQTGTPTISIDQQGSTDISNQNMSATEDGKVWTYSYTVEAATGGTYIDGAATVTIKSSTGSTISITSGSTFTINTVVLSATVTYAQGGNTAGPFKAGSLTITVGFNATVTNPPKISINQQGTADITNDSSFTGPDEQDKWTYTYTINAKDGTSYKDGTATVSLKNSDDGDADIPIGSGSTFSIDTTAPTVALTYSQGGDTSSPFKAGNVTITATFSEDPAATPQIAIDQPGSTDISATDMTATGSALVFTHTYAIQAATGGTYVDGDATVTVTNGNDTAGNANATATNNTFTIDTTAPDVAIDAVSTPTGSTSQTITGTVESGLTPVITTDTAATAGTVTKTDATHWTCTVSNLQTGNNVITATATDSAGNAGAANATINYQSPTVELTYSLDKTKVPPGAQLTITATFNLDQTAPTIAISGSDGKSLSATAMSGTADAKVWTYAYTVPSDAADDATYTITIGNAGGAAESGDTFTIDASVKTANITFSHVGGRTSTPFPAGVLTITAVLSEAATGTPTISIDQPGTTDITDQTMTGSGTTWTYDYTIQQDNNGTYDDGTATISITDGQPVTVASGATFTIDTAAPTVAVTYLQSSNADGPFKAGVVTVTATFSEAVATTPQIAIAQPGGTNVNATNMTKSSNTVYRYTYTVHDQTEAGYDDGTATVTITNGKDSAGNENATATGNTFVIDTIAPAVAVDSATYEGPDAAQTITGTKEAGLAVTVSVDNSATVGTVTYPGTLAGTTWSCEISSLPGGNTGVTAAQTDAAGNEGSATATINRTAITVNIGLVTGWNLISIPVLPDNTSIKTILSGISGNYSVVWGEFDPTTSAWKNFDPNEIFNTLNTMEPNKGYWINVTEACTLTVVAPLATASVSLKSGWNLIGFVGESDTNIKTVLTTISGKYSVVWGEFDPTTSAWKNFDANEIFNTLNTMGPGKGYWIKASENTTLTY